MAMDRREFIKAAGITLLTSTLPLTISAKPVVYYCDLAIISTKCEKVIFWGDPQQHAVVQVTHNMTLIQTAVGDVWEREIQKVTGLTDFELKSHPWQAALDKKMAKPPDMSGWDGRSLNPWSRDES